MKRVVSRLVATIVSECGVSCFCLHSCISGSTVAEIESYGACADKKYSEIIYSAETLKFTPRRQVFHHRCNSAVMSKPHVFKEWRTRRFHFSEGLILASYM